MDFFGLPSSGPHAKVVPQDESADIELAPTAAGPTTAGPTAAAAPSATAWTAAQSSIR